MIKICHISDTHGLHNHFSIPECDLLIHSGDIGRTRTGLNELTDFLIWFERQPAKCKIFIAGNHDIILDKSESHKERSRNNMFGYLRLYEAYQRAMELISNYKVKYLNGTDYVFEGLKIWGSPYSPTFGNWAFNADRGQEIMKKWSRIPSDVDILVTHTPVYGILDNTKEYAHVGEDPHVGCIDLLEVIRKRLFSLKLHCSGHIHDNFGVQLLPVSRSRRVMFSNAAVITNRAEIIVNAPLIINL